MPQRVKITFLEDDVKEWPLLEDEMRRRGITEFEFYQSGMNFLAALPAEPPQVCVIDFKLSHDINMDGLKIMLDAKRVCEDCYFIIVTGQLPESRKEDILIGLIKAHADDYIKKKPGLAYYEELIEATIIGRQEVRKRIQKKEALKEAEQWLKDKLTYLNEKIKHLPGNDT